MAPRCQAAAADAAKASGGTPVPKNAILVVGATGTLGRQVWCKGESKGCCTRRHMPIVEYGSLSARSLSRASDGALAV